MRSAISLRTSSGAFSANSRIGRALEPGHRQQPPGRQLGDRPRHRDARFVPQDVAVEPQMRGLALVIEFLAQPVGDLGVDLGGA